MKRNNSLHTFLLGAVTILGCSSPSSSSNDLAMRSDLTTVMDLATPPDLLPTLSARAQQGLTISPVAISTTGMTIPQQELIGIGSYLVSATGCAGCHGAAAGTFLSGGRAFGTVYARNLTPDLTTGMPKNITSEADFITSMRTGTDFRATQAGKTMTVMPWGDYRWMSTYDLKAIYAYLQHLPAVVNAVTDDTKPTVAPGSFPTSYTDGSVSRALPQDDGSESLNDLLGLALQPLTDPLSLVVFTPTQRTAFGRGAYLVSVSRCSSCHTNPAHPAGMPTVINTVAYLTGGKVSAVAQPSKLNRTMSTNLIGMAHAFLGQTLTAADFQTELRLNVHAKLPGMPALGPPMPTSYKNLVDEDLQDIFFYLTNVPRITAGNDKITQPAARYCTMATQATDCNAGESCNVGAAGVGSECVGKACATVADCDACQSCTGNICTAPAMGATCLTAGL